MTDTFSTKQYSIATSKGDRTLYIKVVDIVAYLCYEGNLEYKGSSLDDTYTIVTKCFADEPDYKYTLSITNGTMKIGFSATIGGFFKIAFDAFLKEKVMSGDGQLTMNFMRLEQHCNKLEKQLEEQQKKSEQDIQRLMDIIGKMDVFVAPAHHWTHRTHTHHTANIASTVVTIQNADTQMFIERNIAAFYKLQKLTIGNFISMPNLKNMSNATVTEIELQCAGSGTFTSLEGINNFPNLEILFVTSAPGLNNVVTVLKATTHKIKTLKIQACAQVNVVELQTYCQTNKIMLAIS